jgi:hypothetical protein
MKQNINLYKQAAGPADDGLSARLMLALWVIGVALVLFAHGWLVYANNQFEQQLQAQRDNVAMANESLTALAAENMAGADPVLEARLGAAMRELDLRETILGLVSGNTAGDVDGFSAQLAALARQNADGVWLTRVRVGAPGAQTTLEGRALGPEAVPLYLRQLSGEAALAGQAFDVFEISRPEKAGEAIRFSLNRRDDPEPVRLVRE